MNLKYLKPTVLAVCVFAFFLFGNTVSAAILSKAPNNLGLVGYWSMNEGSGTQVGDASGNKNNGTMTNMESSDWVAGKRGKALDFDGSNENIDISGFNQTVTEATFSAWVKYNSKDAYDGIIFSRGTNPSISGMNLNSTLGLGYTWNAAADTYGWVGGPSVPIGKWVFLVVTVTSNQAVAYVGSDGVISSATNSVSHASALIDSLKIGRDTSDGTRYVNGSIDEVRLYNRALSASEVATLYQSGAAKLAASSANLDNGSSLASGLVGHWTLDGQDTSWGSNTTLDRSGSGNTGTMTNMSTTTSPTPGKLGQGLLFSASGSRIGMGDVSSLKPTSAVSFSGWVNLKDNVACNVGNRGIFNSGFIGASGFHVGFTTTCIIRMFINGTQSFGGVLNRGQWYFISATWDGSVSRLYVDGIQVDSDNVASITYGSENVLLGNTNFGTQSLYGTLDDARLYNRALSATEIAQLYKLGQGKVNASQNKTGNSLDSGLVGLWSFNGPDISWSANTAYDRSGQGNNGTITNMSTTTSPSPGKIGQALKFDGSNDYIQTTTSNLIGTNNITVCSWVYPTSYGESSLGRIIDEGSSSNKFAFFVNGNNAPLYTFRISSDQVTFANSATGSLRLNVWTHGCVTRTSSGTTNFYVNGIISGTVDQSSGTPSSGDTLHIGNRSSGDRAFSGKIDEVRVYNRAISTDEVLQLYRLGR